MKDSSADDAGSHGFVQWVKQPSAWLSVIAAIISISTLIISISTFYLVYARKGDVLVILPDKVGVSLSNGDALLLIPLTFTNTGAPRTVNHVTHVTATLRDMKPHEISGNEVDLHWRFELTTIGNLQYFQKYPEEEKKRKDTKTAADDVVQYVGRTFPFALYLSREV